jgi:hypothetical protein
MRDRFEYPVNHDCSALKSVQHRSRAIAKGIGMINAMTKIVPPVPTLHNAHDPRQHHCLHLPESTFGARPGAGASHARTTKRLSAIRVP